jgi:hypothetical protein
MKKVILFALSALALVSCKKSGNEGSPSAPVQTASYGTLNIKTSGQVVKMAVTSNVLNLVYNEDVTLVLDSSKLAQNWAVHLKEDLSSTQMSKNNFHYHSLTKYGVNAMDWVDDNLNNIVLHSSKDTIINKHAFVIKRITRSFIYQQAYNSSADANKVLEQLLKQTDIITFTSYYAPVNPDVAATVNTAKLTYVKM